LAVSAFPASSRVYPRAITFSSAGEGWLAQLASDAEGVYLQHSSDGGIGWERVPLVAPPSIGIAAGFGPVVADPEGAAHAYVLVRSKDCTVTCTTELLATSDAGATWESRTPPG
jgi:hypothetical protein